MKLSFELNGTSPLLMHKDDVEAADTLKEWRADPDNNDRSVAGDDRSPAWTWQTYLYSDGERLAMPQDVVMVALRAAGQQYKIKGNKTYKQLTQSGLMIQQEFCEFYCDGHEILVADILAIRDLPFSEQKARANKMGFDLFVKRASVNKRKHVRVRPRFNAWSVRGVIEITSPDLTEELVRRFFEIAGNGGIGDWRAACKTPGPFGRFEATLRKS